MSADAIPFPHVRQAAAQAQQLALEGIASSGGGGQPPTMDIEVALLKQRADQSDDRLARIESKLDRITELLGSAATKSTVWAALGTGAAIAFAVIAIFVGVLAYLQDQRIAARPEVPPAQAAVAPNIIINMPPWPTAPPPAPAPRP